MAAPEAGEPPTVSTVDIVRTVVVRGRRLRVSVREGSGPGSGGRVPLLMCNGIGSSLELLTPFVDVLHRLDPGRTIIRFDMPGIGGSPLPTLPYHMLRLGSMLRGLLRELGYAEVDVLGISWGGGLAQQFAASQPKHCRRVVLVATGTGSVMVPARPSVLSKMLTPRRHRDPEYAKSIAGEIYGGSMRTEPERAQDLLHAVSRVGPRRGYFYQLLAGSGWTSLPMLPCLRQPVLVLAGDDDPIIPLINARIMNRLLRRGELHVYRGGHLALCTEAAELAPVIREFLDR